VHAHRALAIRVAPYRRGPVSCAPEIGAVLFEPVAPRIQTAFEPAGGLLPFGFRRQALARPPAIAIRVVPCDRRHGMPGPARRVARTTPVQRGPSLRGPYEHLVVRVGDFVLVEVIGGDVGGMSGMLVLEPRLDDPVFRGPIFRVHLIRPHNERPAGNVDHTGRYLGARGEHR
jgi:hypothetical protein